MLNVGDKILVSNRHHELITEVIRVTNTMAIVKPWNSETRLDREPFKNGTCNEKGGSRGVWNRLSFKVATSDDEERIEKRKIKSELSTFFKEAPIGKLSIDQLRRIKDIIEEND